MLRPLRPYCLVALFALAIPLDGLAAEVLKPLGVRSYHSGKWHVLVTSQTGKLYLLKADKRGFDCVAQLTRFDDVPETDRDVWSHPALVGNRFYVRNFLGVYCFLLH